LRAVNHRCRFVSLSGDELLHLLHLGLDRLQSLRDVSSLGLFGHRLDGSVAFRHLHRRVATEYNLTTASEIAATNASAGKWL